MSIKLQRNFLGGRTVLPWLLIALLAGICSACSMNLRPEPVGRGQSIAGQWQLLPPQREALANTLRTAMTQAQAKQEKRDRRRAPQQGPDGIGTQDGDMAPRDAAGTELQGPPGRRNNWEAREQLEQQEALLNAVLPSNQLQINQSALRVELIPDVGARRRFDMGTNSTLVSNYATLHIESGWQDDVFVIHSKDSAQNIDIIERYQRQGNNLHLQVHLSLPDIKDQLFVASYELRK